MVLKVGRTALLHVGRTALLHVGISALLHVGERAFLHTQAIFNFTKMLSKTPQLGSNIISTKINEYEKFLS